MVDVVEGSVPVAIRPTHSFQIFVIAFLIAHLVVIAFRIAHLITAAFLIALVVITQL